jgi:DnaJ family protein B protein 4
MNGGGMEDILKSFFRNTEGINFQQSGFGGFSGMGNSFPGSAQKMKKSSKSSKSDPSKTSGSKPTSSSTKQDNYKSKTPNTSKQAALKFTVNCTLEEIHSGATKKMKVKDKFIVGIEKLPFEKTFEVKVPTGIASGHIVSFSSSNDFPKDVVFEIKELPHRYFVRKGSNLEWLCEVKKSQLDKGLKIKIPLLDGNALLANSKDYPNIKNGTKLPFKGYGMPIPREHGKRGDLIIKFKVSDK